MEVRVYTREWFQVAELLRATPHKCPDGQIVVVAAEGGPIVNFDRLGAFMTASWFLNQFNREFTLRAFARIPGSKDYGNYLCIDVGESGWVEPIPEVSSIFAAFWVAKKNIRFSQSPFAPGIMDTRDMQQMLTSAPFEYLGLTWHSSSICSWWYEILTEAASFTSGLRGLLLEKGVARDWREEDSAAALQLWKLTKLGHFLDQLGLA